ncbi:uncharacterized protein G2W53_033570 [Senna tora]|uniref:Uncharacterized protein n=1 Tax=Senna tora TaxID=362788 RepID=A0A834T9S1_9FABA|nr:uncharacterized protein G2W53_033570 [Senna tora]
MEEANSGWDQALDAKIQALECHIDSIRKHLVIVKEENLQLFTAEFPSTHCNGQVSSRSPCYCYRRCSLEENFDERFNSLTNQFESCKSTLSLKHDQLESKKDKLEKSPKEEAEITSESKRNKENELLKKESIRPTSPEKKIDEFLDSDMPDIRCLYKKNMICPVRKEVNELLDLQETHDPLQLTDFSVHPGNLDFSSTEGNDNSDKGIPLELAGGGTNMAGQHAKTSKNFPSPL